MKAGRRTRIEHSPELPKSPENPLFSLPEEKRGQIFNWLRECPYNEAVRVMLRDENFPTVTDEQINEFFQDEAYRIWEVRTNRAADEADALVRLAEDSVPKFSAGILAALGQTAFRLIASGNVDPGTMGRMMTLFMKARSDKRSDQMGPREGLALIGPSDLAYWWFSCLFLPQQPGGTTGLARRLNPRAYYLAMRWDYARFPKDFLRNTVVKLTNPANNVSIFARPVDFGPGDGTLIDGQPTPDTGRLADLSPGVATALGLQTDEIVNCEMLA